MFGVLSYPVRWHFCDYRIRMSLGWRIWTDIGCTADVFGYIEWFNVKTTTTTNRGKQVLKNSSLDRVLSVRCPLPLVSLTATTKNPAPKGQAWRLNESACNSAILFCTWHTTGNYSSNKLPGICFCLCPIFFFNNHFYLPAQLAGSFTLSDLLDKPWSQVSSLLPPGMFLQLLSRIGFSVPDARRFSSNVANSRSRAFR